MSLGDRLRASGARFPKGRKPLWKGPMEDGITYSLLCRFLCCRERFRVLVTEGLKTEEGFNHRIEYGQMWHACEEGLAAGEGPNHSASPHWLHCLTEYTRLLCRKYPTAQEQIDKWYNVCKVQFPLYVEYWENHADVQARKPLLQEHAFNVGYLLPSGRVVRLRGKWDSVDLVKDGYPAQVWLQENKTKGDIYPDRLKRELVHDLQTMMYLVALYEEQGRLDDSTVKARLSYRVGRERHYYPIAGVRYNVVRRPLSGGKGTIVQHKPTKSNPAGESKEEYYGRLRGLIAAEPDTYFMRWNVDVAPVDVVNFRRQTLDPILEQLCDWWEWVRTGADPFDTTEHGRPGPHWRHPFGVYNALNEGGSSDLDEYLATGSTAGLRRVDTLFPELEEGS